MRQECEEQLRAMDEPIANLKAMVNRMMEQLTPREREVLNQRFGNSKSLPLV
jgi:DNA-directed RNA polymerase sigma subunit (sigma70/sigma32)